MAVTTDSMTPARMATNRRKGLSNGPSSERSNGQFKRPSYRLIERFAHCKLTHANRLFHQAPWHKVSRIGEAWTFNPSNTSTGVETQVLPATANASLPLESMQASNVSTPSASKYFYSRGFTQFGPVQYYSAGTGHGASDAQIDRIRTKYFSPVYKILLGIMSGVLLHRNLLGLQSKLFGLAPMMDVSGRQSIVKSGEFFEELSALNVTLAGKHRLTSITLLILKVMATKTASNAEARQIDAALRSVSALRRSQQPLLDDEGERLLFVDGDGGADVDSDGIGGGESNGSGDKESISRTTSSTLALTTVPTIALPTTSSLRPYPDTPFQPVHSGDDSALQNVSLPVNTTEAFFMKEGLATSWRVLARPCPEGFVRLPDRHFICQEDSLGEVYPASIEGEEHIRRLAVIAPEQLGLPDTEGVLHSSEGIRMIEGHYGYYPLFDGGARRGWDAMVHRVAYQGRPSMAEVSFDALRNRWFVLGAQQTDSWFSSSLDQANDIHIAQRLFNAAVALRMDASRQSLGSIPFLETRSALLTALDTTIETLIANILRFQSRPVSWTPIEQERLHSIWSALAELLPASAQWTQVPLIERQLLLAENLGLFYNEYVRDFPLNSLLHSVQLTALGMHALDGLLENQALLQLSWRPTSKDVDSGYTTDVLLYSDSKAVLSTYPILMCEDVDLHMEKNTTAVQTSNLHAFAAWLYEHRASVALIKFSARDALCSFEHARDAGEVADIAEVFLMERPAQGNLSYVVEPRDPIRSGYV